ncbi:hypothetical protein NBRC10512_006573 [Rhodotorula toruloides]|uniref:LPPG:FO 2-phospho-L-lactate transferase CofD/UPF0052 n=1 Tax=Rhodotorula toruloides (strain NP11) TaxID=1130832 RepID=M7WQG7_RHOT1|nr:LPPG:FO 2-phospho-L-lactate transferase CofD/UPF0052 [Rhodotorula toruloides NP11]EMS22752.1 LPPG:FO 2-phospho-L-lactate transferase CofD/UPF0052 [Rhodotorula toruloides NP11]KAJ8293064.1 hypothetical protein OF846_003774 [Rhodotorula toruloides]
MAAVDLSDLSVLSTSPNGADSTPRRSNTPAPPPRLRLEDQHFCVLGGGTGCNAVLGAFNGSMVSYCLPVSDDGGSSSEIQRVLGGPALGDIRSRLIRLIPPSPAGSPLDCIRRLLEYRLPGGEGTSHSAVKQEWGDIVEGTHRLWRGFNFKKASIGNLFLSGASLFLGSVPSAIFLFVSVTGISQDSIRVIPVINTSSTVTIAAELEDGSIIAGQSEISHPCGPDNALSTKETVGGAGLRAEAVFPLTRATTPSFPEPPVLGAEEDEDHAPLPLSPEFTLSVSPDADIISPSPLSPIATRSRNLEFTKDASEIPPLPSRIRRIFYLSTHGLEIHPRPNSTFLQSLRDASILVYAPGSLYTSIVPCLALKPVGELVARGNIAKKVLLLNATDDRETPDYDAVDYVWALAETCGRSFAEGQRQCEPKDVVTHLVYLRNGKVEVDEGVLRSLDIQPVAVGPTQDGLFDDEVVKEALARIMAA